MEPQDKVIVKKNPKYWDAANVKLDQVVYYPIDDNNTAFNMYLNGELDWQTVTPRDRIEEAKKRPDFQNAPYLERIITFSITPNLPLTTGVSERHFSMAFNRKELVEKVTKEEKSLPLRTPPHGWL